MALGSVLGKRLGMCQVMPQPAAKWKAKSQTDSLQTRGEQLRNVRRGNCACRACASY